MAANETAIDFSLDQQLLATTVYGFLGALTTLMLIILTGFLFYHLESSKALLGRKNLMLFLLLVSQASHFIIAAVDTRDRTRATAFARYLFLAFTELFYLWLSWIRAYDIVGLYASKAMTSVAYGVLLCNMGVCFVVPIAWLLPLEDAMVSLVVNIATAIVGLGICMIDVFLMYACLKQLFQKTVEVVEFKGEEARAAKYYPIIAKYGLAASCCSFAALLFYVGFTVLDVTNRKELESSSAVPMVNTHLTYFFLVAANVSLFFVAFSLVSQKVKLVQAATSTHHHHHHHHRNHV
ncbi:hypothetical protein HDU78_002721 [Chytriomyces hyalinus]|nr:hypothetical protein HDU78_002721 [Chytriomyces hyalinus]